MTVNILQCIYDQNKTLIRDVCKELGEEDMADELIEKFLTKPNKKGGPAKKTKDPNAPKKPKSAYMWFCDSARKAIMSKYPNLSMGDVSKKLGKTGMTPWG